MLALIVVTCAVMLLFYDYHWQDYDVSAGPQESAVLVNKPEATKKNPVVLQKFADMHQKYEDMVGYVSISNTGVQYYVFQSDDDEYYLSHNRSGKKSTSGEIFLDYRCDIGNIERRLIVYGHNMRNSSMFGSLDKFKKKAFWEKNPIVEFDTLYACYRWQIFSVQIVDIEKTGNDIIRTDFRSDEEWYAYILNCKLQSLYAIPVQITKDDIVLTLSTCTYEYDDARLLIHAKLIQ